MFWGFFFNTRNQLVEQSLKVRFHHSWGSLGWAHLVYMLPLASQGINTKVLFGLPLFLFSELHVCISKSRLVKAVFDSKHTCLVGKIYTSSVECQLEVFSVTL